MRALVTGAEGFVGGHLAELLAQEGYEVWGTVLDPAEEREGLLSADIRCQEQLARVLTKVRPQVIFHLAALSSVKDSWQNPLLYHDVNVLGTVRLLENLRKLNLPARALLIGSAEEYGFVNQEDQPVKETAPLKPVSPYGASKGAQSVVGLQYAGGYGLDLLIARAFNHIGPGQSLGFITADFAKQIADIEAGLAEPVMKVGNLDSYRDFTDVRDIVKAYLFLAKKGKAGEVYNVSSGKAARMKDLLDMLLGLSQAKIEVVQDPARMRPSDLPVMVGDNHKIRQDTGWQPEIPLEESLKDILNYWRQAAAAKR